MRAAPSGPPARPGVFAEDGLLVDCARVHLDPARRDRVDRLVAEGLDWPEVVRAARKHGLYPLLGRHLGQMAGPGPDSVRVALAADLRAIRRRNLAMTAELFGLLGRLDQAGVRALPYKGPVLAGAVYGDVGLREFVDLDILVDPGDVRPAKRVLAAAGFRAQLGLDAAQEAALVARRYEHVFVREDGLVVELQWRVAPAHFVPEIPFDELWARQETALVAGRPVAGPSARDHLLVLALHGTNHLWSRLGWVADVAELVRSRPDLDWRQATDRAERLGMARILRLTLLLAAGLLGAPVPTGLVVEARRDPAAVRLAGEAHRRLPGPAAGVWASSVYHLRARERLVDRRRYLVGLTVHTTPGDWTAVRLPRGLFPLYYVLRAVRLGMKYGGLATRHVWREAFRL